MSKFKSKSSRNLDVVIKKSKEEKLDDSSLNFSQDSKLMIDMDKKELKVSPKYQSINAETNKYVISLTRPPENNFLKRGNSNALISHESNFVKNEILNGTLENPIRKSASNGRITLEESVRKTFSTTINPNSYLRMKSSENFMLFSPVKRRTSLEFKCFNDDGLNTSRDKPLISNSETDRNNHEIIDQERLIYDISKKHISFSKRISNKKDLVKENTFLKNSIDIERRQIRLTSNVSVANIDKTKTFWKRVRIFVLVINTITFIRKDVNNFGVRISKNTFFKYNEKNLVDCHNLSLQQNLIYDDDKLIKFRPFFIILPNSMFYYFWYFLKFLVYLYFCLVYLFRQGFLYKTHLNDKDQLFYFDILVELFFLIEIFLNFIIAKKHTNGSLEINLGKISHAYLSEWFIVDLMAIFPFFLLKPKIFEVFGIIKFLRILKLAYYINEYSFFNEIQNWLNLRPANIKMLYFFINSFIMCFAFACVWGFISRFDDFHTNWIFRYELLNTSPWILFIKSLYFGYTMFITVGYGDITVFTTVEIIIVCVWIYFSALFYTFSLTSLSNIFLEANRNNLKINNKCNIVEEIFRGSQLKHLTLKTTEYLKKTNESDKEILYNLHDVRKMIEELPLNIKVDIAESIYDGRFKNIGISNMLSRQFIANIIPLMQFSFIEKSNYIYYIDDVPEKLYFITEGSVCLLNEESIVWQNLSQGSYFGDIEILRKSFRDATTKTREHSHLLTLTKSIVWKDIYVDYQEEFQFLIRNMIKRYKFYLDTQIIINKIIEEGKALFCKELADIIAKNKLNFGYHNNNAKYFFGFGILDRLNQLKIKKDITKETENIAGGNYNIEAINNVLNSSILRQKTNEKEEQAIIKRRNKKVLSIKTMKLNMMMMKNQQKKKILRKNTINFLPQFLKFDSEDRKVPYEADIQDSKLIFENFKNKPIIKIKNKTDSKFFENSQINEVIPITPKKSNSEKKIKKVKFQEENFLKNMKNQKSIDASDFKVKSDYPAMRRKIFKRKQNKKSLYLNNKLSNIKKDFKKILKILGDIKAKRNSKFSSINSDFTEVDDSPDPEYLANLKNLNFNPEEQKKQ